jgi:entericidin B
MSDTKGTAESVDTAAYLDFRFLRQEMQMIGRILVSLLATLFFAGAFGPLAGCNTMEGAGKDIQQGGQAIKDEARERR